MIIKKLSDLSTESLKNGRIFSVGFTKKDGSTRFMLARTGVKKHLRGGELKYDPTQFNNLVVWSIDSKGYRTINLDTIFSVTHNGVKYVN